MSALPARSRSLRKPTSSTSNSNNNNNNNTGSSTIPTSTSKAIGSDPRHASPSRLPVNKPPTRSLSTATSSSGSARSLNGTRTTTTTPSEPGTSSSRQNELLRKESTRYPPSTSTTRPGPSSMTARPTSSDGTRTQAPRRVPTHTRAKSTSTAKTSLNPPTVLRPPSQGTGTAGARIGHRRIASTDKIARPAAPPDTNTPPPPPPSATAAAAAAKAAQPRLRPAFSALQQHYSPAKAQAAKPLTSTFLAPPSPSKLPANLAASAEASRLQTELLQLHLLHRDADTVSAAWQTSARTKLGERFELLGRESREVAEQERTAREEETVLALRAWSTAGGLERNIRALDAVLTGVWTLTEPGGRYARVVRRFERWLDQVSELQAARQGGAAMHRMVDGQALFVGELDTPWKDELSGLLRRLGGWQRQLDEIGEPPHAHGSAVSSICSVLRGLRGSVEGMLEEVHLMEEIEQDALLSEEAWIEATNREDDDIDTQQAGAIWRVV